MSPNQNPYESGAQKVIPSVLVYGRVGGQVLMLHRIPRTEGREDFHKGKWNGLGGKCDLLESPLSAAQREFKEEAGIDLPAERFKALGVLQFPNFKPHKNEDWIVFVFTADLQEQEKKSMTLDACEEGTLHWISESEILKLNLWSGDHTFIPYVLERKPFFGTLWYKEGQIHKHWISSPSE